MDGLEDKVIIVAGAAAGIGAATARRLARDGALLVVADIQEGPARQVAESIEADGGTARAIGFDITDADSVDRLIKFAVDEFGGLDGLHNNVADLRVETCAADTNILDIDLAVWNRTFEVNLTGFLLTMRRAIPELLKRGGGAIVNTSSVASFLGEAIRPAYGASKAGVNALTRHVAAAYGRAGIRCNSIAPGSIATEQAKVLTTELVGNPEVRFAEVREKYLRSHRDGKAEDVASMVALLMSDEGSWINGQCISVDGGWLFR